MSYLLFPEQKRKEAIESANELTQALVDHLNVGYVVLYAHLSYFLILIFFQGCPGVSESEEIGRRSEATPVGRDRIF